MSRNDKPSNADEASEEETTLSEISDFLPRHKKNEEISSMERYNM